MGTETISNRQLAEEHARSAEGLVSGAGFSGGYWRAQVHATLALYYQREADGDRAFQHRALPRRGEE